ncbi:hypothetical protein LZZ90_06715 [Flavobacterium sp. SM15]|uniref:hypothetical protein n=1 Tax=Flavobacterium sp. SM15 TaxID=2908005 RepID=UPI001EDACE65|nr:hypothetical protein [Flavobacterium sp. SM15]MCG2611194.1 hypothetical protein [Flavobacterium sp. SM15]
MAQKTTLILLLFFSFNFYAQVGIGTNTPDINSVLEVSSFKKGVLITRVALTETISPLPLTNHVAGMIVYNTSTSGTNEKIVVPGFYYNNGTQWIRLEPLTTAIGDIKHSIVTTDHNGWYLLNGRNTSTLPVKAQTNASSIGFGTTLPDATDRFLKGKSSSETLMANGGTSAIQLTQSNLPNVTFNGTANTAGSHTHDYEDKYHSVPENLNLVTGLLGILSGLVLNILNNDVGSDSVSTTTSTSSANGNHSHTATISTGGTSAPLNKTSHLVTNTFVYLGK